MPLPARRVPTVGYIRCSAPLAFLFPLTCRGCARDQQNARAIKPRDRWGRCTRASPCMRAHSAHTHRETHVHTSTHTRTLTHVCSTSTHKTNRAPVAIALGGGGAVFLVDDGSVSSLLGADFVFQPRGGGGEGGGEGKPGRRKRRRAGVVKQKRRSQCEPSWERRGETKARAVEGSNTRQFWRGESRGMQRAQS